MAWRPSSVCPSVCLSVNFFRKSLLCETNGSIATKVAHDGLQVSAHLVCVHDQGQRQRSRDTGTFVISRKSLLRFFARANGWIATKLAHDDIHVSAHPGWAQGQGPGNVT